MSSHSSRKRHRALTGGAIILCCLGVILLAYALITPMIRPQSAGPLPGPTLRAVPTITAPPSADLSATAKDSSDAKQHQSATPLKIPPGEVQQIYIPSPHAPMNINAPVAAMPTSCAHVIDPPRDKRMRGAFQCTDYGQASSDSRASVVLAGHSSYSHAADTVFDHLSCTQDGCKPTTAEQGCTVQRANLTGRIVYLRTSTSGDHWLMYRIDHVSCPSKDVTQDLDAKSAIWKPTPGRLILVTCLEQAGASHSTNNLIAVGSFIGVK